MEDCASLNIRDFKLFDLEEEDIKGNSVKPRNDFFEFEEKDIHQSITARFRRQVEKTPGKIALKQDDRSFSYGFLEEISGRLARAVPGRRCGGAAALLFHHGAAMIIGIIGVLKAGCIYVPLLPGHPVERLKYMIRDCGARLIVTDNENFKLALQLRNKDGDKRSGNIEIINIDEPAGKPPGRSLLPLPAVKPGDPAYILYTSGSTGRPKGVVQNHRNVLHFARVYTNALHIHPDDRFTLLSPYSFDAAQMDIYGALLNGGTLYPYDIKLGDRFLRMPRWLLAERITVYHSVPTLYRYLTGKLAHEGTFDYKELRFIVLGGEAVYKEDVENYRALFPGHCLFINGLGPTESTVTLQYFADKHTEVPKESVPVGYAVDRTEVFLMDDDNRQAQVFQEGEIVYKSAYLALGYLNHPDKTAAAFGKDPITGKGRVYRSGDLGKRLPDGSIQYAGRRDFQVKIRGFRVELPEIEGKLDRVPGIGKSVVAVRKGADGENYLAAYYTTTGGNRGLSENQLVKILKTSLPDYMIPGVFFHLPRFPLTSTGKVDRKALAAAGSRAGQLKKEHLPPRDALEATLVDLWKKLLNLEKAGIDDNFFASGGNSLKAIILSAEIRRALGVKVPLAEIFQRPTNRELAAFIRTAEAAPGHSAVRPVEKKEYYPLSAAQKRIYVLQQMDVNGTGYNMPFLSTLAKDTRVEAVEAAVKQLVARHESLRTAFVKIGETPVQRVFEPEVVDFSLDYYETGAVEARAIIDNYVKPFDLTRPPLLRSCILKTAGGALTWLIDMHHIISDGTSQQVLAQDFNVLTNGGELPLLRLDYKDFSGWQRGLAAGESAAAREKYWLDMYAGEIPRLELPPDYERPDVFTFAGAGEEWVVSGTAAAAFKGLAARHGGTLYMNVLAALNTLFYKYTGQTDIIIGTAAAGRSHADLQGIIGMFINTLAMRNYPSAEKTYETFLKEVIESSVGAFENQDFPFEELVDRLEMGRDTSRNPLFDVCMVVQNFRTATSTAGHDAAPAPAHNAAKFDLTWFIHEDETNDSVHIVVQYYTAVFKKSTVHRLLDHFKNIVHSAAAQPSLPLRDIEIITPEEKEQVLHTFNDTFRHYPADKTIHRLFAHQAKKTPDYIALVGFEEEEKKKGDISVTYSELAGRSDRLAHLLIKRGVRPGAIVGIMMERSVEMIISILGTLKAGGAYLPIDPDCPQERIDYMLADSGAGILLATGCKTHSAWSMAQKKGQIKINSPLERGAPKGRGVSIPSPFTPLAYIIYTSGSTGRPKGTLATHAGVVRLVKNTNYVDITPGDRILQLSNYAFDGSVFDIFGALLNGAALVLARQDRVPDAQQLAALIRNKEITMFFLTTALFNGLVDWQVECFAGVGKVLFGGEQVSVPHCRRFLQHYGPGRAIHVYGPTETTVYATYYLIDTIHHRAPTIPIGRPISNTTAYILDPRGKPLPVGVPGEICIGGPGLARGYLNQPELTGERFVFYRSYRSYKSYRTGDLARWLPGGDIQFMGRIDHQVKIRGFRIEPGEIEKRLVDHELISEAVVLVGEDKRGEKYLYACFVAIKEPAAAELREFLSRALPAYMIPAYFMRVDKMPLNANGKVDKQALPAPPMDSEGGGTAVEGVYKAPGNPLQKTLADLWAEVLGLDVKSIGIDHDFFLLGGHSLKAMALIARLHKTFAVEVPLVELFKKPTIRGLADYIAGHARGLYLDIRPVEKKRYYGLSSAQQRLYFLDSLETIGTSYNISAGLEVTGALDRDELSGIFLRLIRRHEALRTSFRKIDGTLLQEIHPAEDTPFTVDYSDHTRLPGPPPAAAEIMADVNRPFDLSRAPLLRVKLVKITRHRRCLFFQMHHIIADGTSMGILVNDFVTLYNGRPLEPLRIQYKDYAEWQNRPGTRAGLARQQQYWLDLYGDTMEIPRLALPTDYARPEVFSFAGETFGFDLDPRLAANFRKLCGARGLTLYMGLLGVFNILLHRCSGREDIIVGSGIAGRSHENLQDLMGLFVNILPMRNYPHHGKTFGQFFKELRENTLKAFENQDMQFEDLVRRLGIQRDPAHNPLFDVCFVVQNIDRADLRARDLSFKKCPLKNNTAKFDITLYTWESGDDIHFTIEYCTDLFKAGTMQQLKGHFLNIIGQIAAQPALMMNKAIGELDILAPGEKRRLLSQFNAAPVDFPGNKTVHQLFEEQVDQAPDHAALVAEEPGSGPHVLTYGELNRRANRLARYLHYEKGVNVEDRVAIWLTPSLNRVIAVLGVLKAGAAYLPIDPELPAERVKYMLDDAAAGVVISGKKFIKALNRLQWECDDFHSFLCMDSRDVYGEVEEEENQLPRFCYDGLLTADGSPAYIIYTSGTTGNPKGVVIQHRSLVNLCCWHHVNYNVTAPDHASLYAGFGFDASVWELFPYLLKGSCLHIVADRLKLDMEGLNAYYERHHITIAFLPTQVCRQFTGLNNRSLRVLLTGGDKLQSAVQTRYRLYNNYGPTENTVVATSCLVEPDMENIPIGWPMANTQIYILEPNRLRPQPVGIAGELCIAGTGLARGYLNRPELTAERFVHPSPFTPHPSPLYKTGDLACWLPGGDIRFMGRIDSQVKIRGYRIELAEIETRLLGHNKIKDAAVIAREDEKGDRQIYAYVVTMPGPGAGSDEGEGKFRDYLAGSLPGYMIPHYFVELDVMPLTANGKINAKALPDPLSRRQGYVPPVNEAEKALARVWHEVLGTGRPGTSDNFFRVGGDSIKAIQVTARLRKYGLELSVGDLFLNPTIKEAAKCVKNLRCDLPPQPAAEEEEEKENVYPLSPMQGGMFFHALKSGSSPAYFEQTVVKITGPVDRDLMKHSFHMILARHDILRTLFRVESTGEPVQVVLKQRDFELHGEDISQMDEARRGDYLDEFAAADIRRGFDLTRDPLMRAALFKTAAESYTLVWSFHHILLDGWCIGIIYKELIRVYRDLSRGRPVELGPAVPYVNYIRWLQARDKETGFAYWREYLEGYEEAAILPKLAVGRRPSPAYQPGKYTLLIDEREAAALDRIAGQNRVTLNTLFQTIWGILLQRYTNSGDVVYGAVVSGRPPEIDGIEQMVGLFINTVPVRVQSQPDETFDHLLEKINRANIRSKPYEYLPLAEIQAKTPLRENLVDHIMAFENLPGREDLAGDGPSPANEPGQLRFQVMDAGLHNQTDYDFNIIVIPNRSANGGAYPVRFSYNSRVYHRRFIKALGLHLKEIIKQVTAEPGITAANIDIVTRQEKEQVLYDFNRSEAEYPREQTIHGLFVQRAQQNPDRIAVIGNHEGHEGHEEMGCLTYRELDEKSNRLARVLMAKGVTPDTIAAVMMGRCVEMITGILAILKVGAAYLPIDPDYPRERIDFMLKDSSASILLTLSEISSWSLKSSEGRPFPPATCNLHLSLAYVIYTSGTMGQPKGVLIHHRCVVRLMVNDRFQFDFNNDDVWTVFHSFCFDFSVWEMYGALLYGGKSVVIPAMAARDTAAFLDLLKKHHVTVLNQTPSAFYRLMAPALKEPAGHLSIRYVIFGGEALSPGRLKDWRAKYPAARLVNMYGITETTVHVTFKEITGEDMQAGISNIGKPIPTLKVYIINQYVGLQPMGTAGELWVSGAGLARGYLNRPELTAEKFLVLTAKTREGTRSVNRSYKTGDLARWLPGGNLEYLGRIDRQVKIRGYRIESGEIENRLLSYGGIEEAAVILRGDNRGDTYLCAYIAASKSVPVDALRTYLADCLPGYMIPAYFVQLDRVPLTANGKVDRKALPEPVVKAGRDYIAPRRGIEKKLAALWSDVLGIGRAEISMDANFFQLGGHSLKAAVLAAKIRQVLEVKIPLEEIFAGPTIKEMGQYIEGRAEKEEFAAVEPTEEKEYYPVSTAQKRLYLLYRMDGQSTADNVPAVFTVRGRLEKNRLEQAFAKLIRRHESLRTTFHMVAETPVQRIHDRVEFGLEDVTASIRPFDLAKAPLLRVGLTEEGENLHTLVVDMHHIVTDGTSMALLMEDFAALYRGKGLAPAVLRIRYRDYSQWQHGFLEREAFKRREAYWTDRFSGEIPVLDLPLDYPRPVVRSFAGRTVFFTIGEQETRCLKGLALQQGVSLFMVTLAAFNVFLARLTGREHIVVGTPAAGRGHADLQKIIGMFVNTLALNHFPNGEKNFYQFLKEVGKQTLAAFENQDYPFEDLVDRLVKQRDTGRNPLFDAMFVLQNMERGDGDGAAAIPGLTLEPRGRGETTGAAKFDLTLRGFENNEHLSFAVEYCIKLFKEETVHRFSDYFKRVIASISEHPGQRLRDIEIISPAEKQKLLFDFNDTPGDYPVDKTILDLIEEQAGRTPDRIAVTGYKRTAVTYRELNKRSHLLAGRLTGKGIGADTIVAIMMGSSLKMITGILGILKAGAAYLPIDPDYPEERKQYILKDSGAKILLNKSFVGVQGAVFQKSPLPAGGSLAYVIYTSGSTGKPKGVLIGHRGLYNTIRWRGREYRLGPKDHVLQLFSFSFDGFVTAFFTPLVSGAPVVLLTDREAGDAFFIKDILISMAITHFITVPSLYASLLELCSAVELPSLRVVTLAGEALKGGLVQKSKQLNPRLEIVNEYGPTETTVAASFHRDARPTSPTDTVPIGGPIAHMKIYLLDRYRHPVPTGVPGELYIAGPGVARGYLNRPALTAERFVNRSYRSNRTYIYRSGDLAKRLPGGDLQFLGRIDFQVKIRGFRVEPGEIENRLMEHEQIKDAVVTGRREQDGSACLCAYWVRSPSSAAGAGDKGGNGGLGVSQLREFLAGKLAPYLVPSYFVRLDAMPRGANGKIHRSSLPEPVIAAVKTGAVAQPADPLEKCIIDTWKEVLGVESVGSRDNFFDLGGNSLKIIRVGQKLNEALGIQPAVVDLFQYPTVSSLKGYLQRRAAGLQPWLPGGGEKEKEKEIKVSRGREIAVIGMAGRFPGAGNIGEFWENVKHGIDAISFFSPGELEEEGVAGELCEDPRYVRARGILADKDRFDAAFFNYTPPEARVMDPQMRILHHCIWETLEDAGYNPETYEKPIGLYAGAPKNSGWEARVHFAADEGAGAVMNPFEIGQLVDNHFMPARISYKFDLKGPAVFVHTACSTSLVAVHMACNGLMAGDCAMALAGGVTAAAVEKGGYLYREGMVMSPDGRCRAFDAGANGTVPGEGAAAVLLKPLEAAIEDRDHIYAVIKGSAVNNDGSRKVGFAAPGIDGQAETIAGAMDKAGVPPESITYIETHGTGTALGDPIEMQALNQALNTHKKGFCAIGSLKTNIGHLDAAAGAAGFIKTVLALQHKQIPPSLHFEIPNPQVTLIDSPFYVNTALCPWERGPFPLRAGVSSFGIGGTNAHVVLEEWPEKPEEPQGPGENQAILLSARTPGALQQAKKNLLDHLKTHNGHPALTPANIAYTLRVGRKSFTHRWQTICSTTAEIISALESRHTPKKTKPNARRANKSFDQTFSKVWPPAGPPEAIRKTRRVTLPTYPFEGERYWIRANPLPRSGRAAGRQNIADWFYFPRWVSSTPPPRQEQEEEENLCFLVFIDNSSLVSRLVEALRGGRMVVTAAPAQGFSRTGERRFTVNPGSGRDYNRLFAELKQRRLFPRRILHCWNVAGDDPGPGFYGLLHMVRALVKQDFSGDIVIDVLTAGLWEITGDEQLNPAKAMITGPLKVIPQEYPYLVCRCIDVQLPAPGSRAEQVLTGCLLHEVLARPDAPNGEIAYRGPHRWLKTYEPVRLGAGGETQTPAPLKERGVYLVTGGCGNIGLRLAGYLARQVRARLILTGTSPLSAHKEREQKVRQLEADGAEVRVFRADAGDKAAMEKVICESEKIFGPINGVIHAAGITRGPSVSRTVEEVEEEDFQRQFGPKVRGVEVLAALFRDRALDFCILTSSLSPILGGLGFAAYSAANAFMDAFVYRANRGGSIRWLSVGWADWGFDAAADAQWAISPAEGIETFKRVLTLISTPAPRVVISAGHLETRLQQWVKLAPLRKNKGTESSGTAARFYHPRPHLSTPYCAPRTPMEQGTAAIWKRQLGIEKIGTRDDFFQLGGDSLKAISMLAALHKELNARVPLQEFFARPFIETLARFIPAAGTADRTADSGFAALTPVEEREYYPLSPAQKRLYLLDRMGAAGTVYNLFTAIALAGKPDRDRLEQTFAALVKRHQGFRTSFIVVDDGPVQKIEHDVEFKIEGGCSPSTVEEIIKKFVRPFDLSRSPLLRAALVGHILVVDMHHIIFDGVSQQVFLREFADLYDDKRLPALPLQYKDYSQWRRAPGQQAVIEQQQAFWLNEMKGEIPVLDLPLDYARPRVQRFEGGAVDWQLSEADTKGLRDIARTNGATMFMVTLTIYYIFLARITGREDITVGTPTAGRRHADLENIIGMFVNTLVMRHYPAPHKTFRQLLGEVRTKTPAAFENQDYQFEELVEKLSPARDTGRNPLFDTLFVLQNIDTAGGENKREWKDLNLKYLPVEKTVSQFDLVLEAAEREGRLRFSMGYCSSLFRRETVLRFAGYLKRTAAAVIENPDVDIAALDIIPREEKKRLLRDFNDTASPYPQEKTIHRLFEEQAEQTPHHIAVACGRKDVSVTYRELEETSNRLARVLIEKGVLPDTIVAIMMEPSIELITAILAILKAGGAYLPIEPNIPEERKQYILKDSGTQILLTPGKLSNDDADSPFTLHPSPFTSLAYVIYTSGTTGRPKGTLVEHRSLVNLCCWHNRFYGVTNMDRTAQYAGFGFDAAVWEIFPYLIKGAVVHIAGAEIKRDILGLIRYYRENHITIAFLPTQFCQQFNEEADRLPALRALLTGGDKLERFNKRSYRLYNNYGPTENTVVTTAFPAAAYQHNIPIGSPIDNVQVYILNKESLQLQPLGVAGELCIAGHSLARGYLNRPELTVERFCLRRPGGLISRKPPPWTPRKSFLLYRSGDLARWLWDGNIEFLGRIDQQVKIRGFRIELGEIEKGLLKDKRVGEAAVIQRTGRGGDKYLCAYVVLQSPSPACPGALEEFLAQSLPAYMIPAHIMTLEKIPLTANGKLDRKALPAPVIEGTPAHEGPRNEIERKLAALWSELLDLEKEKIGIHGDFFRLGGHSLRAAVLATRIHKEFQVTVPLAEIFKTPSINGLAQYISKAARHNYSPLKPVEKREYYASSSAQKRLYILQQTNPHRTAYNMPAIIPLAGEPGNKELTGTFKKLIQRHESLRTSFLTVNGQPVQRVHDKMEFEIKHITIHHSFIRSFDLARAPLLRAGLVKQKNSGVFLLIDMHHIISDGVSHGVLVKDFSALTAGAELPSLKIQYKDFTGWQSSEKQQENISRQEAYWLHTFREEAPPLNLPLDYPGREQDSDKKSELRFFTLDAVETAALNRLAGQQGATLFMVLLAIFNILLARLSLREDIVVGTPAAGRRHADLQDIIGMFVNTMALRNRPNGEKTFKTFLEEVKENTLQAFENQDYPYEELVGNINRGPLFDVMFVYNENSREEREGMRRKGNESLETRDNGLSMENMMAKFQMTWRATPVGQGVRFTVEYDKNLLDAQTIENFIRFFRQLVKEIPANPQQEISRIQLAAGSEEQEKTAMLTADLEMELE